MVQIHFMINVVNWLRVGENFEMVDFFFLEPGSRVAQSGLNFAM